MNSENEMTQETLSTMATEELIAELEKRGYYAIPKRDEAYLILCHNGNYRQSYIAAKEIYEHQEEAQAALRSIVVGRMLKLGMAKTVEEAEAVYQENLDGSQTISGLVIGKTGAILDNVQAMENYSIVSIKKITETNFEPGAEKFRTKEEQKHYAAYQKFLLTEVGQCWKRSWQERMKDSENPESAGDFGDFLYDFYPEALQ